MIASLTVNDVLVNSLVLFTTVHTLNHTLFIF